jgi:hypothetical protein
VPAKRTKVAGASFASFAPLREIFFLNLLSIHHIPLSPALDPKNLLYPTVKKPGVTRLMPGS